MRQCGLGVLHENAIYPSASRTTVEGNSTFPRGFVNSPTEENQSRFPFFLQKTEESSFFVDKKLRNGEY